MNKENAKYYPETTTLFSNNGSSIKDGEYQEGTAGTTPNRKSDPLKEYKGKETMPPAKINAREPTAVKIDPSNQQKPNKAKPEQNLNKQL
jgi:hypothetical protein